jgi:membrane protease YdiL (CAAX protease family)
MPAFGVAKDQDPPEHPLSVRDVLAFFGLTVLLTIPFWAVGAASTARLLPGLPLAALAVVCPALAALILSWRRGGAAGARALLARGLDFARIRTKAWWIPILLISPAVSVAAFAILRFGGSGVPDPQFALLPSVALFAVLLASALCEELGWTAFALAPLQARLGWLRAAAAIGAVWAVWHVPALLQVHRSAAWIGWWVLGTIAMRVIMVWLYNAAGKSVFGVAVFHAASNLCWQIFPIHGSWFDPRVNGLLLCGVAGGACVAALRRRGAASKAE